MRHLLTSISSPAIHPYVASDDFESLAPEVRLHEPRAPSHRPAPRPVSTLACASGLRFVAVGWVAAPRARHRSRRARIALVRICRLAGRGDSGRSARHPPPARRTQAVSTPPTAALRHRLLEWYGRNHRELPWRQKPTPYRVWVSEVMLQQTTVKAVLPYYRAFCGGSPRCARSPRPASTRSWRRGRGSATTSAPAPSPRGADDRRDACRPVPARPRGRDAGARSRPLHGQCDSSICYGAPSRSWTAT